ncbi:phenylacetate--CoA ligase family protein [Actinacidiphila yeochonensis]|uniref:phenylacetate--CoA ligase family protein n=1 Tax=Actinacidiphila yeochonensis TaxID=89050 RepID=UPI00056CD973|nr:phenylacetate--CoA ligase family protein [Actinacidiphila yeochonensis]
MLLLRDEKVLDEVARRAREHAAQVRSVAAGDADLPAVHGAKLVATLAAARDSALYRDTLPRGLVDDAAQGRLTPRRALEEVFPALPLLEKGELSRSGPTAFTRRLGDFLHYYESSGTTGEPVAAPKALDDLLINTVNIGELWARLLDPSDRAIILINAPFAPAAYQFEKVLEYLQILSFRPWVDNITGDYTRVLRLVDQLGANVFVGPPSRLLELVQFAHRNGHPAPRFDRLLLMAEQTGPAFVRHLERLTGARAYVCSYGSSETGTIAVTCEHRRLHLQQHSYLLELEDDAEGTGIRLAGDRPDRGRLIVTTLDIPARPLIRYRIGDLVEIDPSPCPCGVRTAGVRTLGRAQDVITLDGNGIRQDDLEAALWTEDAPGPAVFNYMLVVHEETVVVLTTTAGEPDEEWGAALAGRLAPLFPRHELAVRAVEKLPPLASLGQYLGWKLSRVLDVTDSRNWERLPEPINGIVRETLRSVGVAV